MEEQQQALHIQRTMMENDAFSRWLGIQCVAVGPGYCTLQMELRSEMLNGFGIAHGGITYSLADSALAFASNAWGQQALSVETSISHTQAVKPGDRLTALATEDHLSSRIGVYRVEIRNQHDQLVALFKGLVYRTERPWDLPGAMSEEKKN